MWRSSLLAWAVIMAVLVPHAAASTNVDIGDAAYDVLTRLEAEGVIQSGLLTTKPITRREAARLLDEARRNSEGRGPVIRELVRSLENEFGDDTGAKYIKPLGRMYGEFVYSDQLDQELNFNNDGVLYEDDYNFRGGIASRADMGWISAYLNPEVVVSDSEDDVVMRKAYGTISLPGLDFQFGRDSQWWGPGHHGSILLSNNAKPLTMAKLTNPSPVLLPWVFRYLGPIRFVLFATKLEEDRAVPEPYLWGMRVNFKPSPYLEIGLQRTALLGGEGYSESADTWWNSFTTRGENTPDGSGDQRAGMDLKITLPFSLQPIQLYTEIIGEDNELDVPSKRAHLAGLYLPRILSLNRIGFRAEYATTHVAGHPNVWYFHRIYRSGYTYRGRIIGHHIGTDADDLFLELGYRLRNGDVKISYNRERYNLSGDVHPTVEEGAAEVRLGSGDGLGVKGRLVLGRVDDKAGTEEDTSLVMLEISYAF